MENKEKVRPIVLTMADGKKYTLEFNREVIAKAEDEGFRPEELTEKMMIRVPELFYYSFLMHTPEITKEETDKILFDEMGGVSDEVMTRLGELYSQGYDALINYDPKNSKVTITM